MSYIFGGWEREWIPLFLPLYHFLYLLCFLSLSPLLLSSISSYCCFLCFLLFHEAREIACLRPIDIDLEFWAIRGEFGL